MSMVQTNLRLPESYFKTTGNLKGPEQVQSQTPSEAEDMEPPDSELDEQSIASARPAAASTVGFTTAKVTSRQPLTPWETLRSKYRAAITKALNDLVKSDTGSMIAPEDRLEWLYQRRAEIIAKLERDGRGSWRYSNKSEGNESEERSMIKKRCLNYILGIDAPRVEMESSLWVEEL